MTPSNHTQPPAGSGSRRRARQRGLLLPAILLLLPALMTGGPGGGPLAAAQEDPPSAAASKPAVGEPAITVHYTGNEGFLLEVAGKKILIDALYRDGVKGYVAPTAIQSNEMETGKAPFDGIHLALSTHYHADHFHPDAVGSFLKNNPGATYISTDQSRQALMKVFTGYQEIAGQVRSMHPAEGAAAQESVDGINVEGFNLHHGRNRPVENLGFLLEVGGRRILHMGDTESTTSDLEPLALDKKKIDLAFVPFWYLVEGSWRETILLAVAPQRIVVMHMPAPDAEDSYIESLGGWDKVTEDIKKRYPNATIFRRRMETAQF
jgi:L-ascorbate metabolism protein UlaG (beta-lactamase superfamily)